MVEHIAFAHRTIPSLLVNQVNIQRRAGTSTRPEVKISIEAGTDFVSPDVRLEEINSSLKGQ